MGLQRDYAAGRPVGSLLAPPLCAQRQFIQLRPCLPPTRVMLAQKADEPLTMGRLDQMKHLVDDDVLQQVAWLLDEFRVEADVASAVVATSPLRLHAL